MKTKEVRSHGPAPEIRSTPDGPRLAGYAAVYNSMSEPLGGFREIIAPGAFDGALKRSDLDVIARLEHGNGPNTLGRTTAGTLRLVADDRGLWYEVDLPQTTVARDLLELVRRGDIRHSSFAFYVGKQSYSEDAGEVIRTVETVDELVDVAPVSIPAYRETIVDERSLKEAIASIGSPERTRLDSDLAYQRAVDVSMTVRLIEPKT